MADAVRDALRESRESDGPIKQAKEDANEAILRADEDGLKDAADVLAGYGAADEIKAAQKKAKSSNTATENMDGILGNALATAKSGGTPMVEPTGAGDEALGKEELLAAIEAAYGTDEDGLSEENPQAAAAVMAALARLGEEGNAAAAGLATQYAGAYKNDPVFSGYIYEIYKADRSREYMLLQAIGACTKYRYVYYGDRGEVTIAYLSERYTFTRDSDTMKVGKNSVKSLTEPVRSQNGFYIREEDSEEYFGCVAQYIPGSDLALCLPESAKEEADALYEALS